MKNICFQTKYQVICSQLLFLKFVLCYEIHQQKVSSGCLWRKTANDAEFKKDLYIFYDEAFGFGAVAQIRAN